MTRLERLINLVAALLDADRPVTRDELQQRVPGYEGSPEAARRAFERDKETLRGMGIPLTVEPLDPRQPELGDGYRIRREEYELPDLQLEPQEAAALHLAVTAVRLDGAEGSEALWKLGGVAPGDAVAQPVAALPGGEHLPALFAAVSERRQVRFAYRGAERSVDPLWLSFANGRWYLGGRDHLRGEDRTFRLDRIESSPEVGEGGGFERPRMARKSGPQPWSQPWRFGDEEPVQALVLVDADQADWAVSQLGEDAMHERRRDGAVVVSLEVSNREAFRSFVLGFLGHAEVLAPPELRQDMVDWLRDVAAARA